MPRPDDDYAAPEPREGDLPMVAADAAIKLVEAMVEQEGSELKEMLVLIRVDNRGGTAYHSSDGDVSAESAIAALLIHAKKALEVLGKTMHIVPMDGPGGQE